MTHRFTFRPGLPVDASLIRAFVRATFAKWVPVMGREPLPMTADYDLALQNHRFDLDIRHQERNLIFLSFDARKTH